MVFASCLRFRTTERLEAAPRASHPLINEEGALLRNPFGCEQARAIDQDEAGGADAESEPVCVAQQTLNVLVRQFLRSAVWRAQFVRHGDASFGGFGVHDRHANCPSLRRNSSYS